MLIVPQNLWISLHAAGSVKTCREQPVAPRPGVCVFKVPKVEILFDGMFAG